MRSDHALYSDAAGRHGSCVFHRKGRAGLQRAGERERQVSREALRYIP